MIACNPNKYLTLHIQKKFLNPNHRVRALIFFSTFCLLLSTRSLAQNPVVDSLIHWVNTHPRADSLKMLTLHRLSYIFSETDTKKSFAYYEQLSMLSDSMNFTYGKALAQINLGILLSSAGDYESGTKAYFNAMDLGEACGSQRVKSIALNNIGENFLFLKDFDKCRKYAKQAIDINHSVKAWRGVAINYELLHRCDFEQGFYETAKENLDTGMPFAEKSGENYILSQFYTGYAKLNAIYDQKDSADYYFGKALHTAKQVQELRNEFDVYVAEAKYIKQLSASARISLLSEALQLATQTHYEEGEAMAAEQLSAVYDSMNRKDSSMFFYRMYRSASDSLFSEHNRRNVIVNESEWMIKRKELENNNLKQLTTAQEKQIAFKNILLVTIGIGFLLSLLLAFVIYKSIQSRKLKDESVYKQKIAETEMQALRAQMNPHFFFNSLNSIENFIMQNEKKLASDYLNKFARFIRSILDSSFNELIEISKDVESLQLYIDLEQLRFNNKFSYCCHIDAELLDGEYHVPSLLVQPFLENAIIHGIGPSERENLKITLQIRLKQSMIHYIIEDNGIGRKQSSAYNNVNKPFHKSVGMKITQDRINIFNQQATASNNVKIIDLLDEQHKPAGTRIEFAIKLVSYANAQSHIN